MKTITEEEFRVAKDGALAKWNDGRNCSVSDCAEWWRKTGSMLCSFCDTFTCSKGTTEGVISLSVVVKHMCPLPHTTFHCTAEWEKIENTHNDYLTNDITLEQFYEIFHKNAEELYERIEKVQYDPVWSKEQQ